MNIHPCDTSRYARILKPAPTAIRLSFLVAIICFYSGFPVRIGCQTQALTSNSIEFRLINPAIIQSRLDLFEGSDRDREMTLLRLFKEAGCSQKNISEQAVPHHKEPNVICTLPGESSDEIIVGAHFDHAGEGNGVIDNWSGASILPTLFQSLSSANRKHTFVFIGFSSEEAGEIGSRYFLKQRSEDQLSYISLMVNIDSIGLGPTKVWVSRSDRMAVNILANTAGRLKVPLSGINVDGVGESDEEPFIEHRIKTIVLHSLTDEGLKLLHSPKDASGAIKMSDYLDTYKLLAAFLASIDKVPEMDTTRRSSSPK